jgi:penicillin amidase
MSRSIRVIGVIILVIAVLVSAVGGYLYWFTRQAIPKSSGTVRLEGLGQPVEIVRDQYGVAHIYASTSEDLFFAQGYVHAQERFWQMEFQRRTAAGRLSEIFGANTLETDRYLRHFNFYGLTTRSYQMLDTETRSVIDAYTAGVNAYIANRRPAQLGLEFALLGVQGVKFAVETWTPVDSMIWAEMMIYDQGSQPIDDIRNIELLAAVGQDRYNDLNPAYRDDRPTILESDELIEQGAAIHSPVFSQAELQTLASLWQDIQAVSQEPALLAELGFGLNGGSNSFAVSGERTSTGEPLLANDPHMSVNAPALWYEIGMHCKEKTQTCPYNFRGFSLPGVPGILIGHNDRIAWGLTNASFDAEDVFIERINPENPNQYEVNGEWVDMEIRREEIRVRGQDNPVVFFVRSTRNGVIASDYMVSQKPFSYEGAEAQLYALSFAWTALEPVQSVRALQMVNRAQNWDDFVSALSYFDAGKQNWLYADVDGNIGYVLPGKVPIRAGGDGTLPVPGWNDDYRWTGFIPYEEMPKAFNPERGFIVTANNPQVRYEEYPFLLSASHDRGQRAQRITSLIEGDRDGITVDDMIAIQTDNQSLSALEIIPYLKELSFDDPAVAAARDRLLGWDAQMKMDSPEAALFNIFWTHLLADTYNDQVPANFRPGGNHEISDAMYFLLQQPGKAWWDKLDSAETLETRDDTLKHSFEAAYAEGVERFGSDINQWRWGELHTIFYRHATLGRSGIQFIEDIFNRGPFPTNGSESVPQKTCWNAARGYEVTCIPALRQVIDLSNLGNSRMIHSLGQSGHPLHPTYDHFIDDWRNFRYHASNWERQQVESGPHDVLTLEPRR